MAPIERKPIDLKILKESKLPIVFIVGGPGAGKGTQCELIVAKYKLTHLSAGDLLRAELASGSPLSAQLKGIMDKGELVPLEVVLDLIKQAMVEAAKSGSKGFLIDGYPRDVKQGMQFESEIEPSKMVLYFDVAEDVLVERLLKRGETSGRTDDNAETIKNRLKTFNNATRPVVDYYDQQGKLVRIKGEGTKEDIFREVSSHLDKVLKA